MLEAGLEFEGDVEAVLAALLTLPSNLLPMYFSHDENVGSDSDRIEDRKRFESFFAKSQSGFFLLGNAVTYSVRIAAGKPVNCDCFIDLQPLDAIQFLVHMAEAGYSFGFACAPAEREHRNRISVQQGANKIESWVGRDTQKYVPGFYWTTVISSVLASKHGIPLASVRGVALEHFELPGGQHHFFRFYERPEDWQSSSAVAHLCASLPGVFNIEQVRPKLSRAKNFLELNSILKEWK